MQVVSPIKKQGVAQGVTFSPPQGRTRIESPRALSQLASELQEVARRHSFDKILP